MKSKQLNQLSGYGETLKECFSSIEASSRLEGFEPTERVLAMREAILDGTISPEEATQAVLLAHQAKASRALRSSGKPASHLSKK